MKLWKSFKKFAIWKNSNKQIRKILEASEIALKRPRLNEQIESKKLLLFRKGVTWEFYNF